MSLIRRVRGVGGTMGVWAAAFAAIGVAGIVPLSLLGALPPYEIGGFLRFLVATIVRWGSGGAGMGLVFAVALLLGERSRTLFTLSPRRFALWGFLAGASVPIGMAVVYQASGRLSTPVNLGAAVLFASVCGAAGAALAAATLRAVRRPEIAAEV